MRKSGVYPADKYINVKEQKENEQKEKEFLKLIGLNGTIFILRYLNEHDSGQYSHFKEYINTHSLNQRLRTLLHFNLVEHHYVRTQKKKECYRLTEKGRKVLMLMEKRLKQLSRK